MARAQMTLAQMALFFAVLAVWELVPRSGLVDPFFTSQPSLIAARIWNWAVETGELARHVRVTAEEAAMGFVLGVLWGGTVGLLCGLSDWVSRALFPMISIGNSLPKLAFAPLLIGWFGFGPASKVALAAAIVFFFVFFAVYSGIRSIDRTVVANARVLGGTGFAMLRHLYIPAAIVWIFAGVRLALAYAFAAAVVGEYLGGSEGLGFLIVYGKEMMNMTDMFAGLVVVMLIVGVLDALLRRLEVQQSNWSIQA